MRSTANCSVKRWRWLAGHIVSVGRSRISDFRERLTLFALELIDAVNKRVPRLRYATTRTFGDGRIVHRKGRTRNSLIIFFDFSFKMWWPIDGCWTVSKFYFLVRWKSDEPFGREFTRLSAPSLNFAVDLQSTDSSYRVAVKRFSVEHSKSYRLVC